MAEPSRTLDARTRKTQGVMLHRLAIVCLGPVALTLGVDDSTVQRTNWERIALTLTALGLKPVPVDSQCFDAHTYAALKQWGIEKLSRPDEGDSVLNWDTQK